MNAIDRYSGVSQMVAEPPLPSERYVERACPGILNRRDMTALFIVILFFMTNVPSAVAGGPAGLVLWLIGGLCFLCPCAIATAQLSVVYPYEGALYVWTHKVFGGSLSFFVGFCAWVPCPLLILATADLVVTYLQGVNPQWLIAPWQQGMVLLGIVVFSYMLSVRRQRMIQSIINMVCLLSLLAAGLVFVAGLVWLFTHHPPATDFRQFSNWNPFTATNIPLFGVITLGYLGVNLPLNMGGELAGSQHQVKRRIISGHLLWGTLIVLGAYLVATFGVLVVQGPNAGYVLFALASTVSQALGPVAGGVTIVCILTTCFFTTAVYNSIFARFLFVGGIDQRLPSGMGKLNRNRVPSHALLFQTVLTCLLISVLFFLLPLGHFFPGQTANLAVEIYFIGVGAATVLWAFATLFLFLNLLGLLVKQHEQIHRHRLFPTPVLWLSAVVGLTTGILAIIDTIVNSYNPTLIPNGTWWYLVTLLTAVFMIIGLFGGMFATSEAAWEGLKHTESSSAKEVSHMP
ncbi:MAG: APC family permease [Ktedonobacteraceae bacterium]